MERTEEELIKFINELDCSCFEKKHITKKLEHAMKIQIELMEFFFKDNHPVSMLERIKALTACIGMLSGMFVNSIKEEEKEGQQMIFPAIQTLSLLLMAAIIDMKTKHANLGKQA